ncbi:MAG: ATPase, T2SS/T4P/T4SS family [Gammaproteobacteria bacterium]
MDEDSDLTDGAGKAASNITRSRIGMMTYLALHYNVLDEAACKQLSEVIDECLQEREKRIVIDLATVRTLSSTSLGAILDAVEKIIHEGGWLKVANVNPHIRDILDLAGVSDYVATLNPPEEKSTSVFLPVAMLEKRRLGDELVSRKLISETHLQQALEMQGNRGKRIGQILVEQNWIAENDLLPVLAQQLQVPYLKLNAQLYDPAIIKIIDKNKAAQLCVFPLFKVREVLLIATPSPLSIPVNDEIEDRTGCKIKAILASRKDVLQTINEAYSGDPQDFGLDLFEAVEDDFEVVENLAPDDYAQIDELAEGSPVINMVNSVIQRAIRDGASDIHIEPGRNKSRIRLRIDGVLYEFTTLNPELHASIVSRLKVMANLDIAERRLPQDGRIQVHTRGKQVDLRFSSLPGLFGEKIVLRVLDKNQSLLDLNKLGMLEHNLEAYKRLLSKSFGLILATGPTGSGKTTSLYAALNSLNSIEKNIVTIEEPVEYQMDIINQNEVREAIGLSFDAILKHVLRQDPDIIMVGEIRDKETAEIAVQAALTGHLVLSTLHTNHAIGAISRMIDMGVEPYLLSSALIGVLGQRLVRTVCPSCKTSYIASPELLQRYGWADRNGMKLVQGRGCEECYDSGYKGRIGIHEVLEADARLQDLITGNPSRDELEHYMEVSHHQSLFDDGLERVASGLTTIEEVSRVINS